MKQDHKPAKPSQQDPEQGNEINPSLKEPYGPAGFRSGMDDPGPPTKKNPGHTNPSHNTPGHVRQDQVGQQEPGEPGQGETQSYPGIKGPKARDLQHDSAIDKAEVESVRSGTAKKPDAVKTDTAVHRGERAKDDALDMPKE